MRKLRETLSKTPKRYSLPPKRKTKLRKKVTIGGAVVMVGLATWLTIKTNQSIRLKNATKEKAKIEIISKDFSTHNLKVRDQKIWTQICSIYGFDIKKEKHRKWVSIIEHVSERTKTKPQNVLLTLESNDAFTQAHSDAIKRRIELLSKSEKQSSGKRKEDFVRAIRERQRVMLVLDAIRGVETRIRKDTTSGDFALLTDLHRHVKKTGGSFIKIKGLANN